jgi:phage gpG-like protein
VSEVITIEAWRDRLNQLGAGGLAKMLRKVVVTGAEDAERIAKLNVTGRGAMSLGVRSGRLRASIAASAHDISGGVEVRLRAGGSSKGGAQVRYAAIHEGNGRAGGYTTIRPKKGKYLTIPVGPALTKRAGVSKGSARDVPGLAVVRLPGGGFGLGKNSGAKGKGKMQLWYILRDHVNIPHRPYLTPALEEVAESLPAALGLATRTAFDGVR